MISKGIAVNRVSQKTLLKLLSKELVNFFPVAGNYILSLTLS
jgi:hypothetical protein